MPVDRSVHEVFYSFQITEWLNEKYTSGFAHNEPQESSWKNRDFQIHKIFIVWEKVAKTVLKNAGMLSYIVDIVFWTASVMLISGAIPVKIEISPIALGVFVGLLGTGISSYLSDLQTLVKSRKIAYEAAENKVNRFENDLRRRSRK